MQLPVSKASRSLPTVLLCRHRELTEYFDCPLSDVESTNG